MQIRKFLFSLLLVAICWVNALAQSGQYAGETKLLNAADSVQIYRAFALADEWMSADHYDSAQLYLNEIHEKISYRRPSLFSYLLTSRQAEVYYYNNLQQLGLQEANRAFSIAVSLKDSILVTDAFNFTGLFYMNMGNEEQAIPFFHKGIRYSREPPYPEQYANLSKPHHLYGNFSEAFEKLNMPDSAIFYARISLRKASEISDDRGMAAAYFTIGNCFILLGNTDSASGYYQQAIVASGQERNFDIVLNSFGGLATAASMEGRNDAAFEMLDSGFSLLSLHPHINDFYALLFLEQAAKIYQGSNKYGALAKTLEMKSTIQDVTQRKNNEQYQTILMNGLRNETRILNLEVAEARREKSLATTRTYFISSVFLLLLAAFIAYRYYSVQKLKLAGLREKIGRDLHDEVGATLSGIALYSYITREQTRNNQPEQVIRSLDIIEKNATEMVAKLSDIVWAINPVHDSLSGLMQRLEEFALPAARARNIHFKLSADDQIGQVKLSMEGRKNIYLICKEAINNAFKYSGCTEVMLDVSFSSKVLLVVVRDNGHGFDMNAVTSGNGLINMKARAAEMAAEILFRSTRETGTEIRITCKITS